MGVYDWKAEADAVFEVIPVRAFLVAAALYIPVVLVLQRAFAKRPPLDTPLLLNAWNAFLSIASGYGAFYVLRDLALAWPDVCDPSVYLHSSARFVLIFNLTKALEWVDTLFLVLKKREVSANSFHAKCIVTEGTSQPSSAFCISSTTWSRCCIASTRRFSRTGRTHQVFTFAG